LIVCFVARMRGFGTNAMADTAGMRCCPVNQPERLYPIVSHLSPQRTVTAASSSKIK
jgi:hypothetical protein